MANLKQWLANLKKVDLKKEQSALNKLAKAQASPDFWQKPDAAQMAQEAGRLKRLLDDYDRLAKDLKALIALDDQGEIEALAADWQKDWLAWSRLRQDNFEATVLNFYAGAGGTDAQDWTQMLVRMYSRYLESAGFSFEVLSQSFGETAGLKSATLLIKSQTAYSQFKPEEGVHRLVRQSPFNAKALRQTSFGRVEVLPLLAQIKTEPLPEKEVRLDFFRSQGHGGQSVNTTDSAVRATHLPTNLVVSIQNERSQHQNKALALRLLAAKVAQQKRQEALPKRQKVSNEWGSQIRNYVLHPYKLVKDLRTGQTSNDPKQVLDGDLEEFLVAGQMWYSEG